MKLNFLGIGRKKGEADDKINPPVVHAKAPDFYRLYKKAHEDRYYLKVSLFTFLVIIFSFFASYSLRLIVTGQVFFPLWLSTLFWFLALSLVPLILISFRGFWLILSCFLVTLSFIGVYFDFFNWPILLGGIGGFLLLLISSILIKNEENRLVKFNWSRILRAGLNYYLIAIILMVGCGLYFLIANQAGLPLRSHFISQPFLKIISQWKVNNLSLDMTVDDYLNQQIGNNLSGQSAKQAIGLMRQDLSQKLNLNLKGNEKLIEVIGLYLSSWFKGLSLLARYIFYLLLVLAAFSVVIPFVWLLGKIITLISYVFLEILLALNYFKLETRSVEKEELTLNISEQ